jgi:hypothetical protein
MMIYGDRAYPSHPDQYLPEFGLSKREKIAAMALQGLLANPNLHAGQESIEWWAVKHADALLKELSKKVQDAN